MEIRDHRQTQPGPPTRQEYQANPPNHAGASRYDRYHATQAMDELEPATTPRVWPMLRREKYVILGAVIVMLVLAFAYTVTATKIYQATADLEVSLTTSTPGSPDVTAANQALAQNYATLLVSPGFLNQIKKQVDGGKLSASELESRLTASVLSQSALVELQATGPSPHAAQNVAQQVISGFIANIENTATERTNLLQSQLQRSITKLTAQIDQLRTQSASVSQISSLTATRQALIQQNATLVANGLAQGTSVTEPASPVAGSSPVSPKRSLNLIAGLLLGLLLGVAMAWARQAVRPALHSAEEVRALVDLPLLASIPLSPRLKGDDPQVGEAYRILLANLSFALRQTDDRIVTVIGVDARVGKTSTVEGLARAAARGERRVLIVDGDMRAASLSEQYGAMGPGLVDVLNGVTSLEQAVRSVAPNVWLLPTRSAGTNAASLLSGNRTFALLHSMRDQFDLVLIDSPPISILADGLLLAAESDAVLLVVRAGVTRPANLTAGANTLSNNRIRIAGLVVFDHLPVESYYTALNDDLQRARTRAATS
jgi:capsular exopolysaccharide synthesis family protein